MATTRAKLAWIVAASIVFSVAAVAYRHHARASQPMPVLSQLETFSLLDQHGKSVKLADLAGNIWVADFIFTGCQAACPMLTSRMHSLQTYIEERERSSGREWPVRLVSFSVDPEVDTPAKLLAYATKWQADDRRWIFLTGSLEEVNRAVTRGLKIPFEKGGAETSAFDVMHGEHFVVVDARGRIRGYFETDPEGMGRLKDAIETLMAEKGA
ncbi:MAG TPA: SCO family protein [Polyangiaceae bacterium]